jgi:hypothetical protein
MVLLLILITILPVVLFFFLRPKQVKDINYGVTFSSKYAMQLGLSWQDAYIKILDDLKIKNIRLVVYWDEVERNRNYYNYSNIRWQLDEAQKRNINVILALGRKVPRYPECFEPDWWKKLTNPAEQSNELYEYIHRTTLALKPYTVIKMWEVENEPFWPFGECTEIKKEVVENEVKVVRSIDDRPIIIQDSGEGGIWSTTYKLGDYLGISMYRKIWYDFWGVLMKKFIYFQYPLAHWTYKIKADLAGVPVNKILVTELQAEPWGPGINSSLSKEEKDKSMSTTDFIATINYAQKTGFKDLYFWGVEWWLFEKEQKDEPFYWDTAKAIFED